VEESANGYLMAKEIKFLGNAVEDPVRPFVTILGGAKVADKLNVIENLLNKADTLIIGGGMAYTFQKAMGMEIGKSLLDEEKIGYCGEMIEQAKAKGVKLLLPIDTVAAASFADDAESKVVEDGIPADWMGLDIGPKTQELYAEAIRTAGTVIWNGPMGVFEFPNFAKGTFAVASAMAECEGVTVIGGGDSASAVEKMGFADKVTHVSTGGGASLEFMEGKNLPGVACLLDK
jgi:phosphoglycerate kinase